MEAANQKTTKFNLSGNLYYPPGSYKQTKDDPGAIRRSDYLKTLTDYILGSWKIIIH